VRDAGETWYVGVNHCDRCDEFIGFLEGKPEASEAMVEVMLYEVQRAAEEYEAAGGFGVPGGSGDKTH